MVCFFGVLLTGLATGRHLDADSRPVLPWVAPAFMLYLAAVVITLAVNAAQRRHQGCREPGSLTSTAAFGCLTWALVACGDLQ